MFHINTHAFFNGIILTVVYTTIMRNIFRPSPKTYQEYTLKNELAHNNQLNEDMSIFLK